MTDTGYVEFGSAEEVSARSGAKETWMIPEAHLYEGKERREGPREASPKLWRRVLAVDLGLFNAALFFLAFIPPSTLVLPELLVMAGAFFCLLGIICHAFIKVRCPGEQWAYFVTGLLGTLTFFAYMHGVPSEEEHKAVFLLFILSGTASAFAAHLIDGGERSRG